MATPPLVHEDEFIDYAFPEPNLPPGTEGLSRAEMIMERNESSKA
jgi:hypothetical protein